MRQITLHPVRTKEWRNHWLKWPRSKQVLATMLLWASRANATKIAFDPQCDTPLIYLDLSRNPVESELPPPPENVVESFLEYLHDITAGDRWFGMLRSNKQANEHESVPIAIHVPDIENNATYRWVMTVGQSSAIFNSDSNGDDTRSTNRRITSTWPLGSTGVDR